MNSELVSIENNFGLQCACAYSTNFSKEIANEILVLKNRVLLNVTLFLFFFSFPFVIFIVCCDNFTFFYNFCITPIYCLQQLLSVAASFVLNYINFRYNRVSIYAKTKWRIETLSYEVRHTQRRNITSNRPWNIQFQTHN